MMKFRDALEYGSWLHPKLHHEMVAVLRVNCTVCCGRKVEVSGKPSIEVNGTLGGSRSITCILQGTCDEIHR